MDSGTELPPLPTGVAVVHEGLLRTTLNDIGWYAKKYDLTPEQVRQVFDKGVIAVVRERPRMHLFWRTPVSIILSQSDYRSGMPLGGRWEAPAATRGITQGHWSPGLPSSLPKLSNEVIFCRLGCLRAALSC
jgi:hypothetical protein